jgi:hypothetical protein
MSLISCSFYDTIFLTYPKMTPSWAHNFVKNNVDTYCLIFGPAQHDCLHNVIELINSSNGKVLYQSPRAINYNYDYDIDRNTLLIFEFD